MNVTLRIALALALAGALTIPGSSVSAAQAAAAAPRKASRAKAAPEAAAKRTARTSPDAAVPGRPRVAPRMLDDIRIEGEIPVPQVLFITARDQRRFMEFQHHRYQVTSLELGRATPGPSRLVVTTPQAITPHPDKAKQEDPR